MHKFSGSKARASGKRIVFVIEKLADRSGGAERVLIEAANAMARRGHTVELVTHEYRGKRPFYDLETGVSLTNLRTSRRGPLNRRIYALRSKFEHLHFIPILSRLCWVSRHGGFWRRLERHLKAVQPDTVVAFMPPAISALALSRLPKNVRKIASTHNAPVQDYFNRDRWDPSSFDRRRRFKLIGKMDKIAVLLPEYQEWYGDKYKEKIVVLPNAVSEVPSSVRNGAPRKNIVVAVGRLASVKRPEMLLRAWGKIYKRFPNWELSIYGIGPLEKQLQDLINQLQIKNAFLRGHTSNIGDIYLSAKILAHPAEFEGFPLAVTEALASGLPVVGFSDCSGLNRLVEDKINGVLVEATGDRELNLAESLMTLMEDEALRIKLSSAGPSSMQEYSPSRIYDQWESLLFD